MSHAAGAVHDGATYHVKEAAEFVIIGSGAAGATMARWLTAAGRDVVVVEEGGPAVPATGDGADGLRTLYRDAGAVASNGPDPIVLLQGRVLGGSSYVAGSVHEAMSEATWQAWAKRDPAWAERVPWARLEAARARIDREMAVQKTSRALASDDAEALARAMAGDAMLTWRGAPGCVGNGRCYLGCPKAGKASVNLTLLPLAVQKGARVYTRCAVRSVETRDGRAVGVRGQFANGYRFTASASVAVIVAAGAIQTPALLLRSGVRGVGRGWTCHPTAMLAGRWHKPLPGPGATQAMDIFAMRDAPFVVETVRLPPAWRRLAVPGLGAALGARLAQLDQVATWQVRIRPQATGRVRRSLVDGSVQVDYALTPADRQLLAQGLAFTIEAMLRAGALAVWPGVAGWPDEVTSLKHVADAGKRALQPGAVPLFATQFFGGVPTDGRGQVPGIERLVVADASMLPGAPGVPPLSLIHAAATVLAETWSDAQP